MRIAIVDSNLHPGGGMSFLINLGGELVRRKIFVEGFSLTDTYPPQEDFARQRIPVSCEASAGTIAEDRILGILRKLARFKPTSVVGNLNAEICEVLRHLPPGVFRVGVLHSEVQLDMLPLVAGVMDALVTVSPHVQLAAAKKLGDHRLRVLCVELGIPLPEPGGRQMPEPGQPLRILYLGSLVKWAKRVHLFPAILERLKKSGIPFVWTIAGAGPDRAWLEQNLVSINPRQKVCFKGLVPYAEVPALLTEHDVLLLTSDTETFSLCLHEGMAAGLVPVVSDLPGRVGQMVTPERGIRVPLENVEGYADAIIRLHYDRAEWHRMSVASAAAIGQECSVATMADRWLAILPPPPEKPAVWPEQWKLQTPLFAGKNHWWFLPPMRVLRRFVARVRPSANWI